MWKVLAATVLGSMLGTLAPSAQAAGTAAQQCASADLFDVPWTPCR